VGKKTGRRWGARTRRCPCLPHLVRRINVQRSKISRPLLPGRATFYVTRSIEEPTVDRFFGRKTRHIYGLPVPITYNSKQKRFETLSSASVRVISVHFRSHHHPHSHLFQTVRMSCPEGKRPYISPQWPLVFSGQKGKTYLSSSTARIDGSVRSKRGVFLHYHLLS